MTSFPLRDSGRKRGAILKIASGGGYPGDIVSDEPIRAHEKCYPTVWFKILVQYMPCFITDFFLLGSPIHYNDFQRGPKVFPQRGPKVLAFEKARMAIRVVKQPLKAAFTASEEW